MGGTAAKIVDTMSDVYGGIQMGTTMVMAHIDGNRLTVAHCGDSRCYVFDQCGKAKYVTTDHNAGESIGTPSAESTSAVRMSCSMSSVL